MCTSQTPFSGCRPEPCDLLLPPVRHLLPGVIPQGIAVDPISIVYQPVNSLDRFCRCLWELR